MKVVIVLLVVSTCLLVATSQGCLSGRLWMIAREYQYPNCTGPLVASYTYGVGPGMAFVNCTQDTAVDVTGTIQFNNCSYGTDWTCTNTMTITPDFTTTVSARFTYPNTNSCGIPYYVEFRPLAFACNTTTSLGSCALIPTGSGNDYEMLVDCFDPRNKQEYDFVSCFSRPHSSTLESAFQNISIGTPITSPDSPVASLSLQHNSLDFVKMCTHATISTGAVSVRMVIAGSLSVTPVGSAPLVIGGSALSFEATANNIAASTPLVVIDEVQNNFLITLNNAPSSSADCASTEDVGVTTVLQYNNAVYVSQSTLSRTLLIAP